MCHLNALIKQYNLTLTFTKDLPADRSCDILQGKGCLASFLSPFGSDCVYLYIVFVLLYLPSYCLTKLQAESKGPFSQLNVRTIITTGEHTGRSRSSDASDQAVGSNQRLERPGSPSDWALIHS